jgi:hypothetical protein
MPKMTPREYAERVAKEMGWEQREIDKGYVKHFDPSSDWASAGVWREHLQLETQFEITARYAFFDKLWYCKLSKPANVFYQGWGNTELLALQAASEAYFASKNVPISLPPKSTTIIDATVTEIVRGKPSLPDDFDSKGEKK